MLVTLLCLFLPAAQAQNGGQVRYFPRTTYPSRMVGGLFQGSNDNSTWTTLATVTTTPSATQYSTLPTSADPQTFRYLRYLAPSGAYGNVAEVEFDAGTAASYVKLTGTAFGTAGSYNNDGFTFLNALDGSTTTYFDAPAPGNGDYVGIDRGAAVGQVRYFPRSGYPSRMVGGQFQGSTDNTNWTTFYTVTASPVPSQYTVAPIRTDPKTLRYLRYLAPPASYDDVAEIEFDSGVTTPVKVTGTGFGTAGSYNNLGNVFSNALDGNTATYFDAPAPGTGDYVGIDQGAAPVLTSIVVSPASVTLNTGGSQQFTAVAKDQNGNALSPQPTVTWSVVSGGVGMITSAGVYSAGSTAGMATVKAINGTVSGTASVTVNAAIPSYLSNLTLNSTSVTGGTSTAATVTLSGPAPAGGVIVALHSNNGAATIPATCTITAGATQTTFNITTIAVSAITTATLSGSYNGWMQGVGLSVLPSGSISNPPGVPVIQVAPGNGCAIISWNRLATGTVSGYNIYRTSGGTKTLLTPTPFASNFYSDTGLMNNIVTYTYQVAAVDTQGHEQALSTPVSVTPSSATATLNWVTTPSAITG